MAKNLLVVLYAGVADWEVSFPLFCLHPKIQTEFASIGPGRIKTAMGFESDAEVKTLRHVSVSDFDGVYLPGGVDAATGRFPRSLAENEEIKKTLRDFWQQGKVVAAICGAPLVLGAAGLLKGKRFACDITDDTHGWFEGALRAEQPIAVDGKILTGSVQAIISFSVELARLLGDEATARDIRDFFAVDYS